VPVGRATAAARDAADAARPARVAPVRERRARNASGVVRRGAHAHEERSKRLSA
jgi:hypothetical protein